VEGQKEKFINSKRKKWDGIILPDFAEIREI
jgi:hypothetical protein